MPPRLSPAAVWLALFAWFPQAQAQPAKADPQAAALVREMLAQRPPKETVVSGQFTIRPPGANKRTTVNFTYRVELEEDRWRSIYETAETSNRPPEKLSVEHRTGLATVYRYSPNFDAQSADPRPRVLTGEQAAIPLAGSDFWLSDLGLEFLHWPEQRLDRTVKITLHMGRPLKVLESINPNPGAGGYAKVVSRIDLESGGVIDAKAYDASGKRLKTFALGGVAKVDGQVQVKEMQIFNDQTDSKTTLRFNFKAP